MTRRYKTDPRDSFVSFRCTEAEITQLLRQAQAASMSLSHYARSVLLHADGLRPSEPPSAPIENPAIRLLADQVRRVGVNINQIAHRLNEHQMILPPNLPEILEEIRSYVREARAL
jgi:hypothetical protein